MKDHTPTTSYPTKGLLIALLLTIACQKKELPIPDHATTSSNWEKIKQNALSTHPQLKDLLATQTSAAYFQTKDSTWHIPISGTPIYQRTKQGYREIVIQPQQPYQSWIQENIPDPYLLQSKKNTDTYTGRILRYNLNSQFQHGAIYIQDRAIASLLPNNAQTEQRGQLSANPAQQNKHSSAPSRTMDTYLNCYSYQDNFVDANHVVNIVLTTNCYVTSTPNGSYSDPSVPLPSRNDPQSQGGGGSPPTTIPEPSNLPGENALKVDPKKLMDCFKSITNPNAAYQVKLLVIEPLPGTFFNIGPNSFGHVALALTKTAGDQSITQVVGYYPTGTGLDKLQSPGQILDNGGIEFNMEASWFLTGENFEKLTNFIANPPRDYDYLKSNCATFAYQAGQAAGIPIPNPSTQVGLSGPGHIGFADTPQGMASGLRQMQANDKNAPINQAGGTAALSKGPCNNP